MASSLTSVECASSTEGRPYMFGQPWAIPGYMEAENYDYGGQGVSERNAQAFIGVALLCVRLSFWSVGACEYQGKACRFLEQLHCTIIVVAVVRVLRIIVIIVVRLVDGGTSWL